MGRYLIKLRKISPDVPSIRITLIAIAVYAIFIFSLYHFFSKSNSIGLQWIILIIFHLLYMRYLETFLIMGFMDNGICTGKHLIEWNTVKSYKWTIPTKYHNYQTLKIEYSKFYSFHVDYLKVFEDQKEEIEELLKKVVRI